MTAESAVNHTEITVPQAGEDQPGEAIWVEVERENDRPDPELLTAPINDSAHAELFAARFGRELVYVPGLGWLHYGDGIWKAAGDNVVMRRAWEIIRERMGAFERKGASTADPSVRADAEGKRRRLENLGNHGALVGVMKLAAVHLSQDAEAFDQHPDLLCVGNGVVDLRTGVRRAHDPDARQAAVYESGYTVYRQLYECLRPLMKT